MNAKDTISIRLDVDELARLDEMRGEGISRSQVVGGLIRSGPVEVEPPTYAEALNLLARSARDGKVQAQVALERALRQQAGDDGDDWFERVLGERNG